METWDTKEETSKKQNERGGMKFLKAWKRLLYCGLQCVILAVDSNVYTYSGMLIVAFLNFLSLFVQIPSLCFIFCIHAFDNAWAISRFLCIRNISKYLKFSTKKLPRAFKFSRAHTRASTNKANAATKYNHHCAWCRPSTEFMSVSERISSTYGNAIIFIDLQIQPDIQLGRLGESRYLLSRVLDKSKLLPLLKLELLL